MEARELHGMIHQMRHDPLLLGVMHYVRDSAAVLIGEAVEARVNGNAALADMRMGGHDEMVQLLTKLETWRQTMPAAETAEVGTK